VRRSFPPIRSIVYWLRFIADCRASSLADSAKVLANKSMYVVRYALHRFEAFRVNAASGWLDSPFNLRGLVKWSPELTAWYVLEDASTPIAMAKYRQEPEAWVLDYLSQGMTVIDIGAHQGRYAIEFSRRVGDTGLVVVVEPMPSNMTLLSRNLDLNGIENVRPIRAACWSCREPLRFSRGTSDDTSRVSQTVPGEGDLTGLPLDDLVGEMDLRRVDWLKIDVEGAEVEVLEGSQSVLREFRPRLFVEFHGTLAKLLEWLQCHDYKVHRKAKDPWTDGYGWVLALPDEAAKSTVRAREP
jgi:FkbM family methyltransferase